MHILYIFADPLVDPSSLPNVPAGPGTFNTIMSIVFGIVGALAVLFIVIGGLRYILAAGDPAKISSARNQIAYALIGLVIAGSAEVIINYVLNS